MLLLWLCHGGCRPGVLVPKDSGVRPCCPLQLDVRKQMHLTPSPALTLGVLHAVLQGVQVLGGPGCRLWPPWCDQMPCSPSLTESWLPWLHYPLWAPMPASRSPPSGRVAPWGCGGEVAEGCALPTPPPPRGVSSLFASAGGDVGVCDESPIVVNGSSVLC